MRERLKVDLSEKVVEYLFAPSINSEFKRSFRNIMDINKAHLIMLVSQKILSKDTGQKIFEALQEIESINMEDFNLDYNLEDLYFNIEKKLIEKIGVDSGGQLHTGRSRNDLYATVTRMNSRAALIEILELLLCLRKSLLKISRENKEVVISGYTHMQPAEPITLGHYFSSVLFAFERDFLRLINAFETTNLCPLGTGAMASTTFPIDRYKTSKILGFTDIMENSLDGIGSRDYMIEIISALNILMNTVSRLSNDLYIWSTYEFSLVEVDDSVSVSSSIMPQKKNPITLEHVKAKSSHVLGAVVSVTASLKNTQYGHSRDVATESQKLFWEGINETKSALVILTETLKGISFNKERMLEMSERNFSTVTELANTIVRKVGISFRQAHGIVGEIVNYLVENNLTIDVIDTGLIRDIAVRSDKNLNIILKEDDIKKALNPVLNVESKNVKGGPAPKEVKKQLDLIKEKLKKDNSLFIQLEDRLNNTKKELYDLG